MTRADDYVKQGNTVTVTVSSPQDKGARKVRLQVIGDKIVRVEATPEAYFPVKQSLMVVSQPDFNDFQVTETEDAVQVKTRAARFPAGRGEGRL